MLSFTECIIVNEITNKNVKPRVAFVEPVNKQTNTTTTAATTTDNNVSNTFELFNTKNNNQRMKQYSFGKPSYSTMTSCCPSTECIIVNEITNKNVKPRVAFVEPVNKQTNTTTTAATTTDNNVSNTFELFNTKNNQSKDEVNNKLELKSNGKRKVDKLKLSLSARFPGWGVITDDDDDDDDVDSEEDNAEWERTLKNLQNLEQSSVKQNVDYNQLIMKDENNPIKQNANNEILSTDCKMNNLHQQASNSYSTTEQSPDCGLTQFNNDEAFYEVHQQLQHHHHEQQQKSVEKHRSSSILTNSRKSLAMIFSQISNNLGFTQQTSSEYSNDRYTSNIPLTTKLSSDKRFSHIISKLNINNNNNNNIFSTNTAVHGKSSRTSLSQQPKQLSYDDVNTIGVHSSDSSQHLMDRSIYNTLINGNQQDQHRTSSSISTITNIHYNKSINPNTALAGNSSSNNNNNTILSTNTTVDRSILVDLLCCTCCTNSDDEDEAYSNLIENHRLARIVTMGAILTILGLIFAYIIRSATEIQIIPNTISSTTSSIINVVNTVNVSTTPHSILNMFNSSTTLTPQFIKQFQNFSNLLQVTTSDDDGGETTSSIKLFNGSSLSSPVNRLISISDIKTNNTVHSFNNSHLHLFTSTSNTSTNPTIYYSSSTSSSVTPPNSSSY
ncbi:hypothetical protein MN116_008862 [Schistosoma mekongi]|uniref:Uncharacterized protein n=1 Tax=Schistosoma mekongi TaxID=38744 RepID=A0AAE2D167_SCHME|nr:hypothetical protein MN116_008862 [Schistosoma mekongi]